jgi:hypothetical protein
MAATLSRWLARILHQLVGDEAGFLIFQKGLVSTDIFLDLRVGSKKIESSFGMFLIEKN